MRYVWRPAGCPVTVSTVRPLTSLAVRVRPAGSTTETDPVGTTPPEALTRIVSATRPEAGVVALTERVAADRVLRATAVVTVRAE